jgi:hypothetical protein
VCFLAFVMRLGRTANPEFPVVDPCCLSRVKADEGRVQGKFPIVDPRCRSRVKADKGRV